MEKNEPLKQSRYNMVLPLGDEYLLYNTRNSALTVIDEDIKQVLTHGNGPSSILQALSDQGFLLDESIDEIALLQSHIKKENRIPRTGYRGSFLGNVEFVNFVITHQCNLNCVYCYKHTSPCTGHMSASVAEKGIAFISNELEKNAITTLFVSFYGGEPLLHQSCMNAIIKALQTICDQHNVTLLIKLFTNGTLLDQHVLDTLPRDSIADIHITFDAPEPLHHVKRIFPDGSSSFDAVLKGALLVETNDLNLIVRINIPKNHLSEVIPFIHQLKKKGIKNANMYLGMAEPRMDYCTHYYSSYGFPGPSDVFSDLKVKAADKIDIELLPSNIGLHFSLCSSNNEYFHIIDVDGSVYKCMSFVGHKKHAVGQIQSDGNLEKTPAYTAWVSRTPFTIQECRECILLPRCRGGCPAIALREHNTYEAPGCFTVDFEQQLYHSQPVKHYINSHEK
jgi:uncharacterized protein